MRSVLVVRGCGVVAFAVGGRRRSREGHRAELRFAAVVAARPGVLASGGRCEGDVRRRHRDVKVGSTVARCASRLRLITYFQLCDRP